MRIMSRILALLVVIGLIEACGLSTPAVVTPTPAASPQSPTPAQGPASSQLEAARAKIKHIVIIMQENRSFDEYFGTYPGADGIPMQNGIPTDCLPDPKLNQCEKPFYNPQDINVGGPHSTVSASHDIDGGAMDGFVRTYRGAEK